MLQLKKIFVFFSLLFTFLSINDVFCSVDGLSPEGTDINIDFKNSINRNEEELKIDRETGQKLTTDIWKVVARVVATLGSVFDYNSTDKALVVTDGYKLKFVGDAKLCLGGICRDTWPSGGAGGYWSGTTNGIYYNGGNVGIGNSNPSTKLYL